MSYNFAKKPKKTVTLGSPDEVYIDIPIYGDLLAKEAEELEKISSEYQKWTQQLFKLANTISEKTGMKLVEVLSCLSSDTPEEQVEALQGHMIPLLAHANTKPSDAQRLQNSSLVILQSRVDPQITLEDIKDLPVELLKQINDVVYQETSAQYQSYEALKKDYEIMKELVDLGESGIQSCIDLINFLSKGADEDTKENLDAISSNLSNYFLIKSTLGK
jgi:hypothetical protein